MGITHFVKVKSGDTYTDRNGVEKESYITIGRLVETPKGNKVIFLEAMPFTWLSGTPPVMYLQTKDREDKPAGATAPAADKPAPAKKPEDDDIPF